MKAVGTKRGRQEAEAPMKKKRARAGKVEGNGEKARKKKLTWEDFWAKVMPLYSAVFASLCRFPRRPSTESILVRFSVDDSVALVFDHC